MPGAQVFRLQTHLSLPDFLAAFADAAARRGFHIHNADRMNMAQAFSALGQEVPAGFDVHLIQVCKPEKAAPSLAANPERAPFIPKFVAAFSRDGATQLRMLRFEPDLVAELVDDPGFPASLAQSYDSLEEMIREAASA